MTDSAGVEQLIIAGAGPVGAVCALAIKQGGLDPLVVEARAQDAPVNDRRTLALSHGSRLILERVGVWKALTQTTAITRIHISHRGGLGRAVLTAEEEQVPALGYVLSYGELHRALMQGLEAHAVRLRHATPVETVAEGTELAEVTFGGASPGILQTRLAIMADGGHGNRQAAKWQHDYAQLAVVAQVVTELPHRGVAYERFTADGPIALLPNGNGHEYALVWVNPPGQAERIAHLSDERFLAELQTCFGGRQGRFLSVAARGAFPLRLDYHGSEAGSRVVRIGNAAQTLHPVAGQGFNIGLRDAWELAQSCIGTPAEALGSTAQLGQFARGRLRDAVPGMIFTDLLVRTFSNANPLLHHARGLGLMALQTLPGVRHFVARRMLFGRNGY